MMDNKYPMTKEGYAKLKKNLDILIKEEKPKVIKEIAEAREFGDLSENAEYDAAKEKQAFVMGKIIELENKIARAEIINVADLNTDKVVFGVTVTLNDLDTGDDITYKIVGEDEVDIDKGKISIKSPIVRGIIGHTINDIVEIKTPAGIRELEIIKIEFIA